MHTSNSSGWKAGACLTRRGPQVGFPADTDPHEKVRQLDASAEQAPELQDAAATSKPSEYRCCERDLALAVDHNDTEKCRVWFGSDAVHLEPEECIHAVALDGWRAELRWDTL